MSNIEVTDTHTLTVHFKTTVLSFIDQLFKIPAFPAGSAGSGGKLTQYIGTGPFILTDYKKGGEATLRKNEQYWNKEKMPAIAEVKWLVIPKDASRTCFVGRKKKKWRL